MGCTNNALAFFAISAKHKKKKFLWGGHNLQC